MSLFDLPPVSAWPGVGDPPPSVHHYTSSAGFLGMIQTGHLWATEATALNDFSEVIEGQGFVLAQWAQKRHILEKAVSSEFADDVAGALQHLDPVYRKALNPPVVHVLCASNIPDDANQWRLYADRGRGFSVELDTSARLALCAEPYAIESGEQRGQGCVGDVQDWRPVLHHEHEREAAFDHFIQWLGNTANLFAGEVKKNPLYGPSLLSAARNGADRLSTLIKTPGFAGENESRVVVDMDQQADDWINFRTTPSGIARTVHLRTALGALSPILSENRSNVARLPITRVVIGPAQDFNLVEPTIKALLTRYGYRDVPIEQSKASLRRT